MFTKKHLSTYKVAVNDTFVAFTCFPELYILFTELLLEKFLQIHTKETNITKGTKKQIKYKETTRYLRTNSLVPYNSLCLAST